MVYILSKLIPTRSNNRSPGKNQEMGENDPPLRFRPTAHKRESATRYNQNIPEEADALSDGKLGQKPPNTLYKRTPPSCLGLAIALVLVAIVIHLANKPSLPPKIWTKEELARYNGTDENLPVLLSILGSVFDVSKGRNHYGVGASYNHFAGRDASRAFVSGNFTGDGLTDSVKGLSSMEIKSIVDWRNFYHKSYIYVGKLAGCYYNEDGKPTKELKGAEAKAARAAQLLEQQRVDEEKLPNCNSRWSQQSGGEVWCEAGYPRLIQNPIEIALSGKMSKRCACFKEDELGQIGLELYEGCDPHATLCKV